MLINKQKHMKEQKGYRTESLYGFRPSGDDPDGLMPSRPVLFLPPPGVDLLHQETLKTRSLPSSSSSRSGPPAPGDPEDPSSPSSSSPSRSGPPAPGSPASSHFSQVMRRLATSGLRRDLMVTFVGTVAGLPGTLVVYSRQVFQGTESYITANCFTSFLLMWLVLPLQKP